MINLKEYFHFLNKNRNREIWFIYFGNKGISGLYTYQINQTLGKSNIKYRSFVSFGYPFNDSVKCFFPITDSLNIRLTFLRKLIRSFELTLAYLFILVIAIFYRPRWINFSLNSLLKLDLVFLKALKYLAHTKIMLTVHDVVPFAETIEGENKLKNVFQNFLSVANKLIVHNEYSIRALIKDYSIEENSIIIHQFPLMDCSLIYGNRKREKKYDFLFVGHLRRNKGIQLLLESWKMFSNSEPNALLFVGGKPLKDFTEKYSKQPHMTNVIFQCSYISELDFYKLLKQSKTVVLPYEYGTNSGVLSHALAAGCQVIYSGIESFLSLGYLDKRGAFSPYTEDALVRKLVEFYHIDFNAFNYEDYQWNFNSEVISVYSKILFDELEK